MIEKHLRDKTYIIVTQRDGLKELCNKHYVFENHEMKERQKNIEFVQLGSYSNCTLLYGANFKYKF